MVNGRVAPAMEVISENGSKYSRKMRHGKENILTAPIVSSASNHDLR